MATGAKYVVQYRRKRELRTNYRKRLNLLKSGLTRLIARPSNKHLVLQLCKPSLQRLGDLMYIIDQFRTPETLKEFRTDPFYRAFGKGQLTDRI